MIQSWLEFEFFHSTEFGQKHKPKQVVLTRLFFFDLRIRCAGALSYYFYVAKTRSRKPKKRALSMLQGIRVIRLKFQDCFYDIAEISSFFSVNYCVSLFANVRTSC